MPGECGSLGCYVAPGVDDAEAGADSVGSVLYQQGAGWVGEQSGLMRPLFLAGLLRLKHVLGVKARKLRKGPKFRIVP